MKHSQNKSLLKEFLNTLSRVSEAVLIFLLKWSFPSHCTQEEVHSKMGDFTVPSSLLRSKLETHFENN